MVVGEETTYRSQLVNRAESPAHPFRFQMPLLATVPVHRVMSEPRLLISNGMSQNDAKLALTKEHLPGAPVVDERDRLLGVLQLRSLAGSQDGGETSTPETLPLVEWPTVAKTGHLDVVIDRLTSRSVNWTSVLDGEGVIVGIVGMSDLIRGYREALRTSLGLLASVRNRTTLIEEAIGPSSDLAGLPLS